MASSPNQRRSSQTPQIEPHSPAFLSPPRSAEEQDVSHEHPVGTDVQLSTPVRDRIPLQEQHPPASRPPTSLNRRQSLRPAIPTTVTLDTPVDLRTLDYLAPCDDNLMCAICHSPFVNPVRLRCDHLFCQECLSTALKTQPKDEQNCPSCRAVMDNGSIFPTPRVVLRMLEELKVKCPNYTLGCPDVVARGFVQHHVEKYCEYEEVDCPADGCSLKIPRKESHSGCLHTRVTCHDCAEIVMEKDIDAHHSGQCRGITSCPHCESEEIGSDLGAHIEHCPEALSPCPTRKYGCTHLCKRSDLEEHLASCALAKLGPFLEAQNERLQAHDAALKHLQYKNEILESGMSSIQATLGTSAVIGPALLDPSLTASPASLMSFTTAAATAGSDNPPFDSATHHLLSLHESLREEVDRVSAALSELDAKSSMLLMNESLRVKEDMAHTNAAVNAIRMQLHWLMSARLQTQSRTPSSAPVAGPSGNPRGAAGGATGGPGLPVRRLSDVTRQETKL